MAALSLWRLPKAENGIITDMNTLVIPCNTKDYDIRRGLARYGSKIEWTQKLQTKSIEVGDTVYIYESAPTMALTMKFVVTRTNITTPVQTHDNNGVIVGSRWFEIEFLSHIMPISYETLRHSGVVNGYIQAARKLTLEQAVALEQLIIISDSWHTERPKGSCTFCDRLTQDRQYVGKLREYRTSEGKTTPWDDAASGLRLSRTMDFFADTGETFRGGEISHSERVHNIVSRVENLIAFTVASTGVKRYVLIRDTTATAAIQSKLQSSNNLPVDEVEKDIASLDSLDEVVDVLATLHATQPPARAERVLYQLVRNPKIALLVKEGQNYICEICGREPFIQKNGKPYAEADHINPLGGAHQGIDSPENMRCLCAQCHAVVTHGSDEEVRELLRGSKWSS